MQHPNDEALRIWTSAPRGTWRAEVEALPTRATINGICWPVRMSVRERLREGLRQLNDPSVEHHLLTKAKYQCAVTDGLKQEAHG